MFSILARDVASIVSEDQANKVSSRTLVGVRTDRTRQEVEYPRLRLRLHLEAIANRLETITSRLEAITSRLEAIATRLEAVAGTRRLEAIVIR